MKIAVTGADGQLGTSLRKVSKEYPGHKFVFLDKKGMDITDRDRVNIVSEKFNFDILINCASYTDVEKAEEEPLKAQNINSEAVKNLCSASNKYGFGLIHISTDFVFSGSKNTLYSEYDEPDPLSVYGKTKLSGEKVISENCKKGIIIRTSWLYSDTHNTFLKKVMNRLKVSDVLKMVSDQTGSPTYSDDLAKDLIKISGNLYNTGKYSTDLFHYCNNGSVSRFEMTEFIIKNSPDKADLVPVKANELNLKAERPVNSALDNSLIKKKFGIKIRDWDEALKEAVGKIND